MRIGLLALICGSCAATSFAQGTRLLNRADYEDRLRAMWLGQIIANWTGLRSEGRRQNPPFLTDDDWGIDLGRGPVTYVLDQDPWQADDDTDIEYVYLHLMHTHGVNRLVPAVIRDGWIAHVNRFIWVSNAEARRQMGRGVFPPATGMATVNQFWLKIDAQLTTEFFGLFCPGMPDRALAMSEMPILTTSAGYATHASQVFMLMHSLASQLPPDMPMNQRPEALVRGALRYIPPSTPQGISKSADIVNFVLADYLSNPDVNNWERTRDRVYERYQLNAAANGFRYRAWTESSVNFASGIMALLYGQGDYKRTIQIGTLSGWDSDNGTATMGGLLGFMLGYDALVAQFNPPLYPTANAFSDRFWILRTRDALPDYLPLDSAAEDTFTMMAARMIPIVEREITDAGGMVSADGEWLLPPPHAAAPLEVNPVQVLEARSANVQVRRAGGVVSASSNVPTPSPPPQRGRPFPDRFANTFETDFSGVEPANDGERSFYSSQGGVAPGGLAQLTVTYDRPVNVHTVRLIEGDHYDDATSRGGWFNSLSLQLRIGNVWTAIPIGGPGGAVLSETLDPDRPFQIIDISLPNTTVASGVRITGAAGGADQFVTCAEIDCLSPPPSLPVRRFDLTGDGLVDVSDLYKYTASPVDLNGDGVVDTQDQKYLEAAVRWQETRNMAGSQRP